MVVPAVMRRVLAKNKLFAVVLVPAFLLRVDAELGYRWQSWFNDSWDYVDTAVTLKLNPARPSGYSFYLLLLRPLHSLALVTISQHLMGLLVAVMIYALARRRFQAPTWVAVLATLPVLFDGFEIQLEHLIMSDTLFLFLIMLAVTLLLWNPRPSWWVCLLTGLLLGVASVVRSSGLPLIAVFALYLGIRYLLDRRWLAGVIGLALCCVTFAAPVLGYESWYDVQHGEFTMSESTGIFLYSRVMTFAECAKMNPPTDLLPLCTTVPPGKRPIAQAYIWTQASPLDRFPAPKFTPVPNKLAGEFAVKAIESQPLDYARTVFDDTARAFALQRTVFPNPSTYDEYLFGYDSVPVASGHAAGGYPSSAAAYLGGGNPRTQIVNPFAAIIRDYQRFVWLPGTVYGLILLVGLFGIVRRWLFVLLASGPPESAVFPRRKKRSSVQTAGRPFGSQGRAGGEALLPWLCSVALVVVPAATAEFDYRYVTTAAPFACLAAAMVFSRRSVDVPVEVPLDVSVDVPEGVSGGEPGSAPSLPRRVPGGSPGGGAADAGHDQRDLAPDAS
jgi:4-amino-4-deoxy-L-arabinose transferase-like glycosyltransferase